MLLVLMDGFLNGLKKDLVELRVEDRRPFAFVFEFEPMLARRLSALVVVVVVLALALAPPLLCRLLVSGSRYLSPSWSGPYPKTRSTSSSSLTVSETLKCAPR